MPGWLQGRRRHGCRFVPQLVLFLVIVIIGWYRQAVAKGTTRYWRRSASTAVGARRIGRAMQAASTTPVTSPRSSLLRRVLFTLQLAFACSPDAVSVLITDIIGVPANCHSR